MRRIDEIREQQHLHDTMPRHSWLAWDEDIRTLLARIDELERLGEALHGGNCGSSTMSDDYDAWRAAVPKRDEP